MLGAYVDVQSYHQFSIFTSTFLGIIILSLMTISGFLLFKNYNQKSDNQTINAKSEDCLFIIASMIVLCMSAIAVAYSPYSGQYGFEEMFVSRYRFISVTLLCLIYLFALSLINNGNFRRLLLVVLPLTSFLYVYSYYFLHYNNVNFREKLVAGVFNFKYHNSWVLYFFDNDWTYSVDVVNLKAIKMGVYQLPTLPFTQFQEATIKDTRL